MCFVVLLHSVFAMLDIEGCRMVFASMRPECLFLRARAFDKQLQTFCEHEQASTHLIFASNSSKGQILRALLN